MTRRRWVYRNGEAIEVTLDYVGASRFESPAPAVFGDYEGYVSPASGKWVEGRRARREDMLRTDCVDYDPGLKRIQEQRASVPIIPGAGPDGRHIEYVREFRRKG